jgi:hypothetical protein
MYIYAMAMFVVGSPDIYETNYTLRGINMRQKNKLHIPFVKLSAIQKDVVYLSIKVLNALTSNIVDLQIIHPGFGMIYEGILQLIVFILLMSSCLPRSLLTDNIFMYKFYDV